MAEVMFPAAYLQLMFAGFLITIAVETAVLVALLSSRHPLRVRLFAGVWLTACTYPVVWLVLPTLFEQEPRWLFLLVAETFAPLAECAIFWFAFIRPVSFRAANENAGVARTAPGSSRRKTAHDFAVITLANLCSFGLGELLIAVGAFG